MVRGHPYCILRCKITNLSVLLQSFLFDGMKLIRGILFLINVLVAFLLLFSTLAGVVAPSRFVGFSLLSYAYVPLLLANVLFALWWMVRARWLCLLSIGVIVLRFSFVPLFFQTGGREEPREEADLKVMNYNLYHFSGRDGNLSPMTGVSEFLRLVREERPDVMCLQECLPPAKAHLDDSLRRMGYRFRCFSPSNNALRIYSRHRLSPVQGHKDDSYTVADIVMNGATVRLVGVHLASYHLGQQDLATMGHAARGRMDRDWLRLIGKLRRTVLLHERQYHDILQPLVDEWQGPLLVMGDHNDTPASYVYHQLTRRLRDTYTEYGSGFGTTYHGPFPVYRIDYQFHSPHLQALSYKRPRLDISDHYPVVATYKIAQ